MSGRTARAGWGVLALAACAHAGALPAALDPCAGPGAATAGWTRADAGPFRVAVPPGYQRREVRGIDSYVGHWDGPGGSSLHFDYGAYSSSLNELASGLRDYRECATDIGGHPAKVVSGYDAEGKYGEGGRKYMVAAAWRSVPPGAHLTLIASSPRGADLPALVSILRSVRFGLP